MRTLKKLALASVIAAIGLSFVPQTSEAGIFGRLRMGRSNTSSRSSSSQNRYLGGGRYMVNGRVLLGSGVDYPFGPRYRIGGIPINR